MNARCGYRNGKEVVRSLEREVQLTQNTKVQRDE
jgi:hypothetical protein